MERKSIEKMSYVIHSFMHEELMLGGGTLLVYAIIHSFTGGDIGVYYGTQDYLSRAAGISISTVKRAISSLLDKGLIERHKNHNFEGYRTTYRKNSFDAFEMEGAPPNDAELEIFPLRYDSLNKISSFDYIAENAPRPKYDFHSVGGKDNIKMTAEQYTNLLKLVSVDVLLEYMLRLEDLIKYKDYHPKSPYKTIKEWIYKDAAL